MPDIIRRGAIEGDAWNVVRPEAGADPGALALPPGDIVVPLALWQVRSAELAGRGAGLWLAPDDDPEASRPWLDQVPLIAVDFPKFTDGRGYSIAYLLRTRLGYRGELRAIGDVLPDQVHYMSRVGFDAFAVRPDRSIQQALKGLGTFSTGYQGAWEQPLPAFRRAPRAVDAGGPAGGQAA